MDPDTESTAGARPGFFRTRRIGDRCVVTNQAGQYVILSPAQLEAFEKGRVVPGTELFDRLDAANLLKDTARAGELVSLLGERKRFLAHGPTLHVVVVTKRCNASCVYCQASRAPMSAAETDMTQETADRVVDLALSSTSPYLTLEFQGGEPLANFPIVQRIVDRALEQNRTIGKSLDFCLVTNLTLMTEEKLEWLLERRVQICTSIDGPEALHDAQRPTREGRGFETTAGWIRRINTAYVEAGLDPSLYRVEALLTTTRSALKRPREIVDTYVDLGCRALFLRPLAPFGFATRTADRIGYPMEAFLEFYREAVDYMIALNRQGVEVLERFAGIFATKILQGTDPNYLDIRSPCGAGIGQLAYHHDGSVFPCDEGRMVFAMGDDFFRLGSVHESGYRELMTHDTVRAMVAASSLEGAPDCVNCAYLPYCGVCPVHNYCTQGSLHGRPRDSSLCALFKGIQDYLFEKLAGGDDEVVTLLRRWSTSRPRDHFVHAEVPVS